MIYDLRFKKKITVFLFFFLLLITYYLLLPRSARAVCPVCTVAVGAGLGLSRWLGIDDTISGLWIGGLILSSSFWLSDWLSKKERLKQYSSTIIITILMYAFVILPLWLSGTIGRPYNIILGIDKIIFGVALGSLIFLTALWIDKKIRNVRKRQLFNYQKVVLPVISLVIASLLIYYYGYLL